MYEIVEVPEDAAEMIEALGTKKKFWYRDDRGRERIFKIGRPDTGENWAEKASCELCSLLGIPHAKYDLAIWRGTPGVVSFQIVPKDGRLVLGNEILTRLRPGYDDSLFYEQREHTVRIVMKIMRDPDLGFPLGFNPPPGFAYAGDVFISYLMIDAWIGNTDRHHENWAVINLPDDGIRLAPTFDHASSLGRDLTDAKRKDRLTTKDKSYSVAHYAGRARSALYKNPKDRRPLSTIEAFFEAARSRPAIGNYWIDQLDGVDQNKIKEIFDSMPPHWMSDLGKEFAVRLLNINMERLKDLRSELK